MSVVSGKILLDSWRGASDNATVYIRLQDTSHIDAAAITVAEEILHDVLVEKFVGEGLEFRMIVDHVEPRVRYQVRVLVDLDGDGEVSVGDYISTLAYPVLTRGHPDYVEIHVHPVG